MKNKRLEILEKVVKGQLTIEQADKELLLLYSVSNSTINETYKQTPQEDDNHESLIKHFKDESGNDNSYDSPSIGGFSDW